MAVQTRENHRQMAPGYLALQLLNLTLLVAACIYLGRHPDAMHLIIAGLALSVLSLGILSRTNDKKNQDRIIRLEENVRLHWIGVDPSGLSLRQMIALRFAPNEELPELVARTKAEQLTPPQIKAAIVQWRADHHRV